MDDHDDDDDDDDGLSGVSLAEADRLLRAFLESAPLYQPTRLQVVVDNYRNQLNLQFANWWPKAVTYRCAGCARDTTWPRYESPDRIPFPIWDRHCLLRYRCAHCEKQTISFWCSAELEEHRTWVIRKHGQTPAWSIEPADAIAKALPVQVREFYRKGLICLSHNFGLGAVGYFRRVVEQVTDHLLDLVEQNATVLQDAATVTAIAEARASYQATERLRIAASLLPPHVRPGGVNPLSKLYESYSEGIHTLSDEDCLDVALVVRATLDFLLPALSEQLAKAREFQASLAKAKRRKAPATSAG